MRESATTYIIEYRDLWQDKRVNYDKVLHAFTSLMITLVVAQTGVEWVKLNTFGVFKWSEPLKLDTIG